MIPPSPCWFSPKGIVTTQYQYKYQYPMRTTHESMHTTCFIITSWHIATVCQYCNDIPSYSLQYPHVSMKCKCVSSACILGLGSIPISQCVSSESQLTMMCPCQYIACFSLQYLHTVQYICTSLIMSLCLCLCQCTCTCTVPVYSYSYIGLKGLKVLKLEAYIMYMFQPDCIASNIMTLYLVPCTI